MPFNEDNTYAKSPTLALLILLIVSSSKLLRKQYTKLFLLSHSTATLVLILF